MALNIERYHVSAGAYARWRRRGKKPTFEFVGTGMDDRDDLLRWFSFKRAPAESWMEIAPVEITTADPPRRYRSGMPSHQRLQQSLARTRREIAAITRRLRQPEWHPTPVAVPPPPARADFGFAVTLDDRVIGSAGIGGRGVVSVDVFLKRRRRRLLVMLHVHGGESFGPVAHRWRRWSWGDSREIDVGQRVRIEVGRPELLDLGEIREVRRYLPTTREEAREHLAGLRSRVKDHARWRREVKEHHQSRPPPRTYPRAPIRAE